MDTVLNRQQRRTIEAALKMAHTHVLLDKNARSVERTQTLEQITEALALLDQAPSAPVLIEPHLRQQAA